MFQSVRPNSPIYLFHKGDNTKLETGYISSQPSVHPKNQMMQFGQQEFVADIVVRVGNNTISLKGLPAQMDTSDTYIDGESIVVSTSKDAINAEITSEKQKSINVINSKPYHEDRIVKLDAILSTLNPEFAEKQVQKEEIAELKNQVGSLTEQVGRLVEALMPQKHQRNEQSLENN
jgi:hypothetical protein